MSSELQLQKYIFDTYGEDISSVSALGSSGNSKVYCFNYFTVKHFTGQYIELIHDIINNEVNTLRSISLPGENYFIKLIGFNINHNIIVYRTVSRVILYDDIIQSYKLIKDVAEDLYILHSRGFKHGDTSVHNIGFIDGRYIFFDFEGVRAITNSQEDAYKDVNDFLENLIILYKQKGFNILEDNVRNIKLLIDTCSITVRNINIRGVSGKTKIRKDTTYFYDIHMFLIILKIIGI
jgi:hypothetical protein